MVLRIGWNPANVPAYDSFLNTMLSHDLNSFDEAPRWLYRMKENGCLCYNKRLHEVCKYAEDMINSGIKLQSSTLSMLRSSLQQLVIDRSGASSPKPPKARKFGGSSPIPLGIVLARPWRSSVMEEKLSGASNSRVGAGSVRGQQPRSVDVEPLVRSSVAAPPSTRQV
ncbi:hypothetical protein KSP40_PGU011757 [Platanthera guangdongensis]|uniref:Pentatricopeptide repeat-containing protein n=1 Tax=Platanthera guangdongensis TaxID=2320717 RepID=A0ABR2N4U3_9ASPA